MKMNPYLATMVEKLETAINDIRSHPEISRRDELIFTRFCQDILDGTVTDEKIKIVNQEIKKYEYFLVNYRNLGDITRPNWEQLKDPGQAMRILTNMAIGFRHFK